MEIVEYPLWRIAADKVLEVVDVKGYGVVIRHETIREWMGVPESNELVHSEGKKIDMDYMAGLDKMKTALLEDSNICLYSVIGVGYEILHPRDQLNKGHSSYMRQGNKKIRKAIDMLANINTEQLDSEDMSLLMSKMNKMAFIKTALGKRKIPEYTQKQIV